MTELCAKSILFSRKFKSPGGGLVYIKENNIARQTFGKQVKIFQAVEKAKAIKRVKFTESYTIDLTLHCCACGFCKQWNKQEIDEVDEGQGIVPEQASCRDKDTNTD